ncbi:MAG TPA: NAD(P)/FAD-dependent oxidoreductase [Bryobacteraceae bacterium]|nr:NAD(P)/FAD-dependent oxidoreductase [Bryobacteraceae bacterium]
MFDVAIIGGGPAGSTAGHLLAQWGYDVAILAASPSKRPGLAECLPPSTRKLFRFLGIDNAVDGAGFLPTTGNTVWWGKTGRRVENYPEGRGYQVLRHDFDDLLLRLAQEAGARVRIGKALRSRAGIDFVAGDRRTCIGAKFVIDCSGRTGVLGRALRIKEKNSRTVALCGVWRSDRGWKLPDASHTLVEAYGDGWAWSVPISPEVRYVAFMVDTGQTKMVRGKGVAVAYQAEFTKTRAFRKIFSKGVAERAPWGCDASLYSSREYSGPGLLLAGDAGSFIDPLSSFGVKKAMVSAWVAAVVVNTCLRRPAMAETALRFYDNRERQVYDDYLRQSATVFRAAEGKHPFWEHRAEFSATAPAGDRAGIKNALEQLQRKRVLRLRRAGDVRMEPRPAIEGREIVLRDALVAPGAPEPLDYYDSVSLPRLVELAEQHRQVPDLFEAYNRANPAVPLPNFLAALSSLVARRILVDETRSR